MIIVNNFIIKAYINKLTLNDIYLYASKEGTYNVQLSYGVGSNNNNDFIVLLLLVEYTYFTLWTNLSRALLEITWLILNLSKNILWHIIKLCK